MIRFFNWLLRPTPYVLVHRSRIDAIEMAVDLYKAERKSL
jgi:hypothetical protein